MAYKLEIRPLATMEVLEAYDWNELQREGLGAEFLDQLETFYSSIVRNPTSFGFYDKTVRQGKMNRFPYVVYLKFSENRS
jgi:toxin ParE1/3/4